MFNSADDDGGRTPAKFRDALLAVPPLKPQAQNEYDGVAQLLFIAQSHLLIDVSKGWLWVNVVMRFASFSRPFMTPSFLITLLRRLHGIANRSEGPVRHLGI
jgi:hypothetical protein